MTDLDKLIDAVERGDIAPSNLDPFAVVLGMTTQANDAHMSYRGSLDAAKALHDALLPDMGAVINTHSNFVTVSSLDEEGFTNIESLVGAETTNPARAWLLAILKAYRAQEQK